ncbi:MAG: polysaccharide biosynthesis tyrosine autokinase [Deltaproteobacteria bacterium]|nr:polysaccharide biosynthesis tyrosine autokinase [Deltaproteobacteria bacterium]
MGNYEALQRAEQERRRKASGDPGLRVPAVDWDATPQSAPEARKTPGMLERLFKRRQRREALPAQDAGELNKRRISILQPESYVAEQFRTLRSRIESAAAQHAVCTVAMTSANPGEGKSTASINFAAVCAMSVGKRVLLVDCDLRRPTIHRSLGLSPKTGLAEVLLDKASFQDSLIPVEGLNLDVLPVRTRPANPSELLASAAMRRLIEESSAVYDRIVLDTPAVLGLPDAKIVSDLCDGLVMVVRADITPRAEVGAALEILDRRRVLGLVLNGVELSREGYGYY